MSHVVMTFTIDITPRFLVPKQMRISRCPYR